jgi:hypothetical protein
MLPAAHAQVPRTMNFQGYLTDNLGDPLDGTYNIGFSLYDVPSGGIALWSEAQSVTVTQGTYNVVLGDGNPLNPADFAWPLWLGVTVESDPEMTPRLPLTSAGYVFNSDNLDGLDSLDFAGASHSHPFSEISGTATDAQIPDDISINHAATAHSATSANYASSAGDADTLDGQHASAFGAAAQVSANQSNIAALQAAVASLQSSVAALETANITLQSQVSSLEARLADFSHFSTSGNDIYITGANLHVRNGTGTTDGTPNNLGNLIVGYDEPRSSGNNKSGSHNIVVGKEHNYSSFGGLVVGRRNEISGGYASVSGGEDNVASWYYTSVSGGTGNTAEEFGASVSGGADNTASAYAASVSGGTYNNAFGDYASVSGGLINTAYDSYDSISGGAYNNAYGPYASVSGGTYNNAFGDYASVSGGANNIASGPYSSVVGDAGNVYVDSTVVH